MNESKLGKGDVQLALSFLLKKAYNMYTKELENVKERIVLEKLLEVIHLERDASNRQQYSLQKLNPKSSMMLDKSAISALQIFSKEIEKKVLSSNTTLYEIFNKCKTSFGTRCLKRWMKQPLQDEDQLQARLDKIEFFLINPGVKNIFINELKKLPDLDRLYFVFYKVAAGKKVRCEMSDLMKIYRVVEALRELVTSLESKDLDSPIIAQIHSDIKRNVECIGKISKMIEKGIDMSGNRDN
jgi:DNA mismatch repair protein MSH2